MLRRLVVAAIPLGPRLAFLRRERSLDVSIIAGRPLTLAVAQSWQPGAAQELETGYRTDPDVRRGFRVSALAWGLGGLTEALIRVPLIYLLPIDVMVGLSAAMTVTTNGALLIWNIRYEADRRHRPRAA